jgi:hypothetical protein
MRVKFATLIATLALVGGVFAATPASADTVSVSVTVPEAVSLTFTNASYDFGSVFPGSSAEAIDSITYSVTSNLVNGWRIDLSNGLADVNGMFSLGANCQTGWTSCGEQTPINTGLTYSTFRQWGSVGTFSFSDDLKVDVPAATTAGTYTASVDYTIMDATAP